MAVPYTARIVNVVLHSVEGELQTCKDANGIVVVHCWIELADKMFLSYCMEMVVRSKWQAWTATWRNLFRCTATQCRFSPVSTGTAHVCPPADLPSY